MFGAEREHKVTVWNETCSVTVYQKSKSVWMAVGDYMGQRVEAKGSSAGSALTARKTATYRGG